MIDLDQTHLDWAAGVARQLHHGLPPSFDLDDLTQVAHMAVWHCTKHYDASRGVPFAAYAYRRVKGSVLMSVRRRHYRDATHLPLGRGADADIRGGSRWKRGGEIPETEFYTGERAWRNGGRDKGIVTVREQTQFESPEATINRDQAQRRLVLTLSALPAEERSVLACTYLMDVPMKLVAVRLGSSLSGAYAIRQRALGMMRESMNTDGNNTTE